MAGERETLVRALLWRRTDLPGAEHVRLWRGAHGYRLEGTAVLAEDGEPLRVEYEVACTAGWETRTVRAVLARGAETLRVELAAEGGRWLRDGVEAPAVAGCLDVDLSVSPATNTLPIRRLGLEVGESREVVAAWLRFPGLELEPLRQRYTRLSERRYRYESPAHDFTAEVEVDEMGLVVRYPPGWERAAVSGAAE